MALIDFYIRNQKLSKIGPKIVADSVNYVDCSFTFKTDDWNGADKWVTFRKDEEGYSVNLVNDMIPKEAGVNLGAGTWTVYVFGDKENERITTNTVTLEVEGSAVPDGGPLPVIKLTEAEQIAAKAQEALNKAEAVEQAAANGEFDGKPGADVTPEQIEEAVNDYFEENPIPGGGSAEVTAESIKNALGYTPADEKDVPTKFSELENDEQLVDENRLQDYAQPKDNYALKSDIPTVPKKVSELENDAQYAKKSELPTVPTNISAFNNDAGYAKKTELPANTSDLNNDSGFITKKDIPAVPEIPVQSVNGKTGAVTLGAEDVGARSNTWMPTAAQVGARPSNWMPTYSDVGAEKAGAVSEHNVSENAHNDIRVKLSELQAAVEAFLDIDDPTLDQLSELIQKIEANAGTITELTNGKVNVSDIVNNLTTNAANKPLSAAQGVVLKGLVDALVVVANNATTTANNAKATADEAKTLATTANTNANTAKTTAQNASDKVDNLEERMDSGEFKGKDGEDYVLTEADKAEIAEMAGGELVPDYWVSELEAKANDIQIAMEKAGKNKSAFLWYTDAHWVNGNSKVSPLLLKYLYKNTPMNKVNFGGDIIGDTLLSTREEMKYLYEWRAAIKDLPNHHSVFGNHDKFDLSSVDYEDDNYRYAFLIAPEENSDMVMGDGNYYYIDNPCEKTRYLYIDYLTSDLTAMMKQGEFICEAIKAVPENWHIVAIAHRWWQYSSSSTPTTGSIPSYEKELLDIFDLYNARGTKSGSNYFYAQDFTNAKGKVEFCIGGHIHVDYDFESEGGIPIIITTADTNQNRVPDSTVDSGTVGTITEAAVYGIVADYNEPDNIKINVIGVGRGTSRVVRKSTVKPTSISDITYNGDTTVGATIDKSKFSFKVNYSNGTSDTVNGASSVSPATIGAVGNNSVTITYTEGATTLNGTVTIVGTPVPVVNLFDKTDPDIVDTGRFNSSHNAVAYQAGQLVTGYIPVAMNNTVKLESDKAQNANGYTGMVKIYNSNKTVIGGFVFLASGGAWTWESDYTTGTFTVNSDFANNIAAGEVAYMRLCVAYTDIESIVITKS